MMVKVPFPVTPKASTFYEMRFWMIPSSVFISAQKNVLTLDSFFPPPIPSPLLVSLLPSLILFSLPLPPFNGSLALSYQSPVSW